MSKPSKSEQFHENLAREEEIEGSTDRNFGIVFTVVFALVGLWPLLGETKEPRLWALITSGVFFVPALVYPQVLAPLNKAWMKFGLVLQKVVSPIILGLLFFVAITPMGILMRLLGKDLLRLRLDKAAKSYWIERDPPGPTPESMQNQF